jgi:hypothetical protein
MITEDNPLIVDTNNEFIGDLVKESNRIDSFVDN